MKTTRVIVAACILLSACGSTVENTPGSVVRASLAAASEGNYELARAQMASQSKVFGKIFKPKELANEAYWREFTLGRKITKVDVTDEEIRGTDAMVRATLTYADQRTMQVSMGLTGENGRWRLTGFYQKEKNW